MKHSIFKKLALAGVLVVASFAAFVSLSTPASVSAASCTKGDKYTDFTGSYSGRDTMTVQTKDGKLLCNDVTVNFGSFIAPDNYNGNGFKNNPTAIPQTMYYNKTITLKKGTNGKTTHTVKVPDDCTNYQIDAYIGPVQTKITTSEGLIDTNAIVGKLFKRLKDDCSVPKVDACNTETGVIEKVEKGKENVAPHTSDLSKCKKVTVCDSKTSNIVTITKSEAESDTDRYVDKDSDKCKVEVCNTETGVVEYVERGKENVAPHTTTLDKCTKVKRCDTSTTPGTIVTITKDVADSDTDRYVDVDSDECKEPETPAEVPSTGPTEIISGIAGAGSLAGAGSMYYKSRRTLFRK